MVRKWMKKTGRQVVEREKSAKRVDKVKRRKVLAAEKKNNRGMARKDRRKMGNSRERGGGYTVHPVSDLRAG